MVRQANANGALSRLYFAGSRSEIVDPLGNRTISYQDERGLVIKDAAVLDQSLGPVFLDTAQSDDHLNVTTKTYDGLRRLTSTTYPDSSSTVLTYDASLNPWANTIATATRNPILGSDQASLVTSYSYDPRWNKPSFVTSPRGIVSRATYDRTTGNLIETIADWGAGHANVTRAYTYDTYGLPVTTTDPVGTYTIAHYDRFGNLIETVADAGTGRLNITTGLAYDALGNVTARTDPNGNRTTMSYNAARRLVKTTDPLAGTTTEYDPDGRAVAVTRAGSGLSVTTRRSFTASGAVASAIDANGNTTRYTYDGADHVSSITDPMGRVTNFSYDAIGRLHTTNNYAIQSNPLENLGYLPNGQLYAKADALNKITYYYYDDFGRLSITLYPDTTSDRKTYDNDNNVVSRTSRAGQLTKLSYDALGHLIRKEPPYSGPIITYNYDQAGRLTAVNDNSAEMTRPVLPGSAGTVQYTQNTSYDTLNRPLTVSFSPAPVQTPPPAASTASFTHSYDATNRRAGQTTSDTGFWSVPSAAASTAYTANSLNQYTAIGATTPTYDANGNLTFDGTYTYGYDSESRLISTTGTSLTVSYAYDALGHRKSKTVNGSTTIYIGDGTAPDLLDYDGTTGQLLTRTIPGPGANDPIARIDLTTNTRTTYIPDIQGSIIAALDSATGALTKQGYRPFGESPGTSAFGYTGQRLDSETGLYDTHARHYSPLLGRFNQPDPIGYAGGNNLYAYVGNDPMNATDPSGLLTYFTGGAGNNGDYINGFVNALQNAGIKNVQAVGSSVSNGFVADAISVPLLNTYRGQAEYQSHAVSMPVPSGEQLNFVGYSWGAVTSAQTALYVAASGQHIDNVVLVGAPITPGLLSALQNNSNIGNVIVSNLTDHGDQIYAGMSQGELFGSVPKLARQFYSGNADGHFYYAGTDSEGDSRRGGLANSLSCQGLK